MSYKVPLGITRDWLSVPRTQMADHGSNAYLPELSMDPVFYKVAVNREFSSKHYQQQQIIIITVNGWRPG